MSRPIEITVPCVAAHLLVTPQSCDCDPVWVAGHFEGSHTSDRCPSYRMVLRFLPTDATTECDTCRDGCDVYECCVTGGGGRVVSWDHLCDRHRGHQGFHDCRGCCLDCNSGRRPLRVGDRIVIRADGVYDYPTAWALQRAIGDQLPHDPRCSSIPGSNGGMGGAMWLCDCGALTKAARPGEVVGHATVAKVLPIVDRMPPGGWYEPWIQVIEREGRLVLRRSFVDDEGRRNIEYVSDHVDAGLVFTPGQVALELTTEDQS